MARSKKTDEKATGANATLQISVEDFIRTRDSVSYPFTSFHCVVCATRRDHFTTSRPSVTHHQVYRHAGTWPLYDAWSAGSNLGCFSLPSSWSATRRSPGVRVYHDGASESSWSSAWANQSPSGRHRPRDLAVCRPGSFPCIHCSYQHRHRQGPRCSRGLSRHHPPWHRGLVRHCFDSASCKW